MATLRGIRTKTGRTWWYAAWSDRNGKTHQRTLRTCDQVVARGLFRAFCAREGLAPRSGAPGPRGGFQEARAAFLAMVAVGSPSEALTGFVRRKLDAIAAGLGDEWGRWTSAAFLSWIGGRSWAPRTAGMHVTVARRFVRWARADGWPCPDFVQGVKPPRVRIGRPEVHTPAQMHDLLEAAEGHPLEVAVHLACRGLSKGDLRTLTWDEVDFKARRILRHDGREKSGEMLPVPLEGRLLEVLKAVPRSERVGRVCPTISEVLYRGNEDRVLRMLCRRAGVPECGWHRLRHSYASMLYAEGVDLPTIGRILGHAPGSLVTQRYVHPDWVALRKAARKGEAALG